MLFVNCISIKKKNKNIKVVKRYDGIYNLHYNIIVLQMNLKRKEVG